MNEMQELSLECAEPADAFKVLCDIIERDRFAGMFTDIEGYRNALRAVIANLKETV